MMISCSKTEEEETVEGFTDYCEDFCIAVNMEISENTFVEERTLVCECQKIFLRKEWEAKQNE